MQNYSGQVVKSYEIKERIGAGGFGEVYRAIQPSVGREVAIKIILPEHANHPEFVKRFETEAQLVARLEHPHIVPLYDYWRDPSGAYLVMRFLRGGSLRQSIDENGAWEPRRVAQMLTQIGAALTFAHRNSVIHRDLKSDNILIDEEGNAYLTDFGIAKDLGGNEGLTRDNILGTPAYLSPEQIRGETATPRSDVYALGIMIYESLIGAKPFTDHTPATLLFKQLNDPLPKVNEVRSELSAEIDDVLQRATAKNSDERYESAIDLARAFADAVRGTAPGMPSSGGMTLDISLTTAEEVAVEPKNPYKGLRSFQQADAEDFYGRDHLINDLLYRLSTDGDNWDFLAVVGPSGSGKSSAVKAGLIPRIQDGLLDETITWFTTDMVPGTHPLEELEAALLSIATNDVPGLLDQLREDERGLVRAVRRILPDDESQFVLFIDQFEEVFTIVEDEDARAHFLTSILNAAVDERSRIKIVITMRADFYDRPLLYAKFGELIRKRTELVLPLTDDELEQAIVGPAKRVGLVMERGLVQAIISDVKTSPGALPLLQYALTELFERREGRSLTLDAYRDIGGTTGALARRAEELFQSFDPEEQAATRQMFLRLVTLGDGAEDTRRRVMQTELLSLGKQAYAMRKVIDQFGKYRLLTFDHDPQTRSSTVEVAHEALIRQWGRVRDWLEDNREAVALQRRLTVAADEWEKSRRDASFLAQGSRLQQFEALVDNQDIALNQTELQFVEMSIEARKERLREAQEQEAREERLRQQARQRLQWVAVVASIAAVVGFVLAYFAISAQGRAENEAQRAATSAALAESEAQRAATAAAIANQNEAEARSLALAANARNALAANDPQLALALGLQAQEVFQPVSAEVLRTLANTVYAPGPRHRLDGHGDSVLATAFSSDSQYALSGAADGTVRVWDVQTGANTLTIRLDPFIDTTDEGEQIETVNYINEVAFHPDNASIAAAAANGNVYVWSFPEGDLQTTLVGHEDDATAVVYSPSGAFIATGGFDYTVRLWGAASGAQVQSFAGHTGTIFRLAFSPDGRRLASSSGDETIFDTGFDGEDRTIRLWNVETGTQLRVIRPDSGYVRALDYSPDGETIAGGFWDSGTGGTIRIYDANTGNEINRFFGHTTPLEDVVFSPDGERIASIAWDRNVRVWDIERAVEVQRFTGFTDRLLSMAWSDNGDYLLLGLGNVGNNEVNLNRANDPTVWLWDVRSRDQAGVYRQHSDWVWAADIHPDGELAVSGGGPLRLPQPEEGEEVPVIDTVVRIWDIDDGEVIAQYRQHTNTVDSVRFHPTRPYVLSAAWDGNIVLWNYESEQRTRIYREHVDEVYMVRFLDDGDRFVSASKDGTARLWDTNTGEVLRVFEHGVRVNGVDVNPDETLIATSTGDFGRDDNYVVLWDLESGEEIRRFAGHTSLVNEVRFHPSGRSLISTSWDTTVRQWDVETGEEVRQFNGHTGNTFGIDFTRDGDVMLTTSQDTTVRMWEYSTGEALHVFDQHEDWVQEVVVAPDDSFAISSAQDNTLRRWLINRSAPQLQAYADDIRYLRDLTCGERLLYRLDPCANDGG